MPLFGSSNTAATSSTRRRGMFGRKKPSRTTRIKNALDPNVSNTTSTSTRRRGLFQRKKPSKTTRIKNTLDPNVPTTSSGRVPLMTRVKRSLGMGRKRRSRRRAL
uniref:Uncharacterized protein n=1 Tax=Mycena chlorophos TaxID=658473 RepID=A0ABQ0L4U8_MYCCL|nr:predicted protein [Mycena chlorophos]